VKPGWASPELRSFAMLHREVEAVLQRCGRSTFDLLLLDADGRWTRDVVASAEEGRAVAGDLGVRLHESWDDLRLVRRMNGWDDWSEPGGTRRAL
jgi:hypothetical protein